MTKSVQPEKIQVIQQNMDILTQASRRIEKKAKLRESQEMKGFKAITELAPNRSGFRYQDTDKASTKSVMTIFD